MATAMAYAVLGGLAASGAGWATRRWGGPGRTGAARWWALPVLLTLAICPLAAVSPLPAAALIAAGGLAGAAVVDAVEGRIPTSIAHGTGALTATAAGVHGVATGEWSPVVTSYAWTAGLLVVLTVGWLLGAIGFGDVRLVPALAPAFAEGPPAMLAFIYVTVVVMAVLVLVRRRRGERARAPLAPAVLAGWLGALAVSL